MTTTVREFALPDLGEGLEDATIVAWRVAVGDVVTLNQVLCEVETAKANVEIPSPFAGRIVSRTGEPGETVAVGATLARIDVDEDAVPEILVGYGPRRGPSTRRRRGVGIAARAPGASAGAPLAKPPVRHLAHQLGVDLAAITPGSGPGGAVTRADVERAAAPTTPTEREAADLPGHIIPLQSVRARVADQMTRSRAAIPDAACAIDVECTQLVAVRDRLRASGRVDVEAITPFAILLRLVVAALREHEILNSELDLDAGVIRVHESIHLGVGTSTDRGLLVPVVRHAEQLSTIELANEVRRLADGARAATLAPSELVGSTFTVSNFGSFGIDDGYPVINHPEVAILGVGAIRPRPVVVDGAVAARPTSRVSCSFDHRVCDGADVGAFLARLRELAETPALLIVDV